MPSIIANKITSYYNGMNHYHCFIIQPSSHRAGVLFVIGIMITILFKFYIISDGTIIIIAIILI